MLVFAEVAMQGSFTEAASKLNMSKSAVSQHIKRLEAHIGQQLLSRNTRGMSLTESGKKLLARSELLQDQVNLALQEINSVQETPSGTIAITIPHSLERDIAVPALKQLCIEFPLIRPRIVVSDEAQDLISEKLDIAIYGGNLKDSNYRALPIGSAREIICASPRFVSQQNTIKTMKDLQSLKWLQTPWQSNKIILHNDDLLTQQQSIDVAFFAQSNTLPTTIEMLSHDMGVALIPEFSVQDLLANGQLVRILPEYQGQLWPFYFVHRFQGDKPIHITRFYQLIKHFFSKAVSG
ncbi:MAG: LysR family transcriptional regulator [Kangiellaceae bacterium]|nr:LysR family transcriptional regulator [Kangiellaceae bacterium]